jgi:hypothetical protein
MLQQAEYTGWPCIGSGCYGSVYAAPDGDWVIKRSRNDGTRTYLEWVVQRTLEGRRMRGMPWVEWVQPDGEDCYLVKMRRYEPLASVAPSDSRVTWTRSVHMHEDAPRYLASLIDAFKAECPGVGVWDVHCDNVMGDDNGEWIVTDPSSEAYVPLDVPLH